jgi:hypothetical protein
MHWRVIFKPKGKPLLRWGRLCHFSCTFRSGSMLLRTAWTSGRSWWVLPYREWVGLFGGCDEEDTFSVQARL